MHINFIIIETVTNSIDFGRIYDIFILYNDNGISNCIGNATCNGTGNFTGNDNFIAKDQFNDKDKLHVNGVQNIKCNDICIGMA